MAYYTVKSIHQNIFPDIPGAAIFASQGFRSRSPLSSERGDRERNPSERGDRERNPWLAKMDLMHDTYKPTY